MIIPYVESYILFLMVAIGTSVWVEPGPRGNEIGRFVYRSETQMANYHCKFCEKKVLRNSNYAYKQQDECLAYYMPYGDNLDAILTDKEKTQKKYAFCNEGEVPGCGAPPAGKQDHRWVCDPGYSNSLYSVYFTCNLTCNYSNKTSSVIYCNEMLEWENVTHSTAECIKPPAKLQNSDDDLDKVLIPVIIAAVFTLALIAIVIVCIYRKKRKYAPVVQQEDGAGEPANRMPGGTVDIPLKPINNAAAVRAHLPDGGRAAQGQPLLPNAGQGDFENASEISSDDSSQSQSDSIQSSGNSMNRPLLGGELRNAQDLSLSDRSEASIPNNRLNSENNNEANICNISNGDDPETQVKTNGIDANNKGDNPNNQSLSEIDSAVTKDKPSNESTSSKILRTSNGSQGHGPHIEVHVFADNAQTVSKNLQVTTGGYSVPLSSSVFINPVAVEGMTITRFMVERKDGSVYTGKTVGLKHCLEKVKEEDAGIYVWTMMPSHGDPITNSFQLYIVRPQRLAPEGQEENRVFSGPQPAQPPPNTVPNLPTAVNQNIPAGPTSNGSHYTPLDPNSILVNSHGSHSLDSCGANIRSNHGYTNSDNLVRSERDSEHLSVDRQADFSPDHLHLSSLCTNPSDNRYHASNLHDSRANSRRDSCNEISPPLHNSERDEECIVPLEARPEPSGTSVEIPIGDSIEDNTQYGDEDDDRHNTPVKLVFERTNGDEQS